MGALVKNLKDLRKVFPFLNSPPYQLAFSSGPYLLIADNLVFKPLPGLKVGDIITGFHLNGNVNTAGNAAGVQGILKEIVKDGTSFVETTLGLTNAMSVTTNTAIDDTTCFKSGLNVPVKENAVYLYFVFITEGASTQVQVTGLTLNLTPGS